MLDIKFIRENKDLIKQAAKKKNFSVDIDALLSLDDKRRELIQEIEEMRKKQNEVSDKIARATSENDRNPLIDEMRVHKEALQGKEEELKPIMEEWRSLMLLVPNIPDMSVPPGTSDADNQEIMTWGEKPHFDFDFKDHVELMSELDIADFENGTKIAGFRGYILKGDGALLSLALWQFAFDVLVEKGFSPHIVPSLLRKESFLGTGYLPHGEDDLYKTQDEEYLAGTAEVAVMGSFMNTILEKEELPKKIVAFSPCFRREAGSHGKDTKGLIRVHEFFKVEQVVLSEASHEESVKYHEELRAIAEEILQRLNLPYRVVVNCAGDLGLGQVKKYDLEAWVPSESKYRETHSCSYFHDFQSRRLNIRYKDSEGKMRYVHSLNNTAIATPRLLVPIIENNQQRDGSIIIPDVLQKYIGKALITKKGNGAHKKDSQ